MDSTPRLPLPSALFEPVVCPSKTCQFKGKPFLLYDGTSPARGNPLDALVPNLLKMKSGNQLHTFRESGYESSSLLTREITKLIKEELSPTELGSFLSGEGSVLNPIRVRLVAAFHYAYGNTMAEGSGSESFLGDLMKALSILNEGSTCLHEMYLKYDLGEMADWIQPCEESIVSSRELAAPMIKSIRKLLLSKSTTPAQKLLWKKAKDWEDIVVKGMDHLTSEMAEPLIQKHIFNKTAVAGFTQLVTKITTPLDLHAILLSDLTGMSSESVKAHCLDRSRWGKRIQQIMKVIDTEGEVEKYLTGEIDVKRALEIENERTGLVKDVYLLEKELDKLRARSMDAKAAIKKLDDELSKLNLNSNPGSLVHPSAASSPKVRSISTPAPVPTPVSTPAPPTKKRRISKSDKGSPGEFLGEMPAVILRMIQYKMVTSCDSEVRDAMDIIVRERPDLCTNETRFVDLKTDELDLETVRLLYQFWFCPPSFSTRPEVDSLSSTTSSTPPALTSTAPAPTRTTTTTTPRTKYIPASDDHRLFRGLDTPPIIPICSPTCARPSLHSSEDYKRLDVVLSKIFHESLLQAVQLRLPPADEFGSDCADNDTFLARSMRWATVDTLKTICERLVSIDDIISTREGQAGLVSMMEAGLRICLPLFQPKVDDCAAILGSFFLARSLIARSMNPDSDSETQGEGYCVCELLRNIDALEQLSLDVKENEVIMANSAPGLPVLTKVEPHTTAKVIYDHLISGGQVSGIEDLTTPTWMSQGRSKLIGKLEKLVKLAVVPESILKPDPALLYAPHFEMYNFVGGLRLYRFALQCGEDIDQEFDGTLMFPLLILLNDEQRSHARNETGLVPSASANYKQQGDKALGEHDLGMPERIGSAVRAYRLAALLDPFNVAAHTNGALARIKSNRPIDFLAAYDECSACLHVDPTNLKAYYRRGIALSRLDQPHLAILDFEQALILDPTNAPVKNELEIAKKALAVKFESKQ